MPVHVDKWYTQPKLLRLVTYVYSHYLDNTRAKYKETERRLAQQFNLSVPSNSVKANHKVIDAEIAKKEDFSHFDVEQERAELVKIYPGAATPFTAEEIDLKHPQYRQSSGSSSASASSASTPTGMFGLPYMSPYMAPSPYMQQQAAAAAGPSANDSALLARMASDVGEIKELLRGVLSTKSHRVAKAMQKTKQDEEEEGKGVAAAAASSSSETKKRSATLSAKK